MLRELKWYRYSCANKTDETISEDKGIILVLNTRAPEHLV